MAIDTPYGFSIQMYFFALLSTKFVASSDDFQMQITKIKSKSLLSYFLYFLIPYLMRLGRVLPL